MAIKFELFAPFFPLHSRHLSPAVKIMVEGGKKGKLATQNDRRSDSRDFETLAKHEMRSPQKPFVNLPPPLTPPQLLHLIPPTNLDRKFRFSSKCELSPFFRFRFLLLLIAHLLTKFHNRVSRSPLPPTGEV